MKIQLEGTLPIALKKMVGQTTIESKKVVIRAMTTLEYLQAQATVKEGDFLSISDLVAMVKLVDDQGEEHHVTYEMLAHTSKLNFDYLSGLKLKIEKKEKAAS